MGPRVRLALFVVGALGLGSDLVWGAWGLPSFGHAHEALGLALLAAAPPQRHALSVVTAINFDYRGLDTLGEEFILFAAVAGVSLLLRAMPDKDQTPGEDASGETLEQQEPPAVSLSATDDPLRQLTYPLIVITFFFGLYIVLLAHLSLGGGFQGGVILSAAWLLVLLGGGDSLLHRLAPKKRMECADALGAGGYALIGLAALATGAAFLENVLPLGKIGSIASAGTIPVINALVALEVAAGFTLLYSDLIRALEETA